MAWKKHKQLAQMCLCLKHQLAYLQPAGASSYVFCRTTERQDITLYSWILSFKPLSLSTTKLPIKELRTISFPAGMRADPCAPWPETVKEQQRLPRILFSAESSARRAREAGRPRRLACGPEVVVVTRGARRTVDRPSGSARRGRPGDHAARPPEASAAPCSLHAVQSMEEFTSNVVSSAT